MATSGRVLQLGWMSVLHGCENKEAAFENLDHSVFILHSILWSGDFVENILRV